MIELTIASAAESLEAQVHGLGTVNPGATFVGCNSDSRSLASGELFVALHGERFDGHDFVAAAAQCGAAGALVNRAWVETPGNVERIASPMPLLAVDDTVTGFGALAAAWRRRFTLPVVAITGSNGKTTVKEMVAAILGRDAPVLATRGNLNNEIGVPMTLCRLGAEHQCAVIEMGANHPGEIDRLTKLVQPSVGVVTLCAPAHLEGFGSIDGVAQAKGEIYAALPAAATAVINADDVYASAWRARAGNREVLTFGLDNPADVSATWHVKDIGSQVVLNIDGQVAPLYLPLPGRHNVVNALAAAAAARASGCPLEQIVAGLASMSPVPGRLQTKRATNGAQVIDDSYNANPSSVAAAIEVLRTLPGERWLVLGDMAELGADAARQHTRVGEMARCVGLDRLLGVGPLSAAAVAAFGQRGSHFDRHEEAIRALRAELSTDAVVLVKGSRSAGMEVVVRALCETLEASCC